MNGLCLLSLSFNWPCVPGKWFQNALVEIAFMSLESKNQEDDETIRMKSALQNWKGENLSFFSLTDYVCSIFEGLFIFYFLQKAGLKTVPLMLM